MGEYADDYFREEIGRTYGFDPGSMYPDSPPKHRCPKCGKSLKTAQGVKDHLRDYHNLSEQPK